MAEKDSAIRALEVAMSRHRLLRRWLLPPLKFLTARTIGRADAAREQRRWDALLTAAQDCPDNARIPRAPGAGLIQDGAVTLHNGLKLRALPEHARAMDLILSSNRGVYQPQQERVFSEMLGHVPTDRATVMIDLGAHRGNYGAWFASRGPGARCIVVQPEIGHIRNVEADFALNRLEGEYLRAIVASAPGADGDGNRLISVDEVFAEKGLEHVDILRCDIGGGEAEMLKGARRALDYGWVDYVLIWTHSQALHRECTHRLGAYGYETIAEADLEAAYSATGFIAARRGDLSGLENVTVSTRATAGAVSSRA